MKISALDPLSSGFTPATDMLPIVHAGKTWRMAGSDLAFMIGGPFFPTSGGALSGPVSITHATDANVYVTSSGAAPGLKGNVTTTGQACLNLEARRSGVLRWAALIGNADAEATGNVGTNFTVIPYANDGSALPVLLQLNRAGTGFFDGAFSFGAGSKNVLTLTPGATGATAVQVAASGAAGLNFISPLMVTVVQTTGPLIVSPAAYVAPAGGFGGGTSIYLQAPQGTGPVITLDAYQAVPAVRGRRATGTPGAPAATTSAAMFTLDAWGWSAAGYAQGALIQFRGAETWSDTGHGTVILFSTAAIGATAVTERMRLTDAGVLQIGLAPQNMLTLTPGAANTPATLATSGQGGVRVPSGLQAVSPAFTGTAVMPGGATVTAAVPDASLDLTFLYALPAAATFTRASANATYFDVNGVLQVAGTDVPRFDYDPISHAPRGLLLEEARTSTMTNSDALGSFNDTTATRAFAATTAPNGTLTGVRLTEDTSAADHAITYAQPSVAANTSYTASAFFKAGTRSFVALEWRVAGAFLNGIAVVVANLNNGTIFSTGPGVVASSITPAGNGWWRVSVTATTIASAPPQPQLWCALCDNTGNTGYTGTTGYAFCWGAQVEVGGFPTSYLTTVAASVTRAADNLSVAVGAWYDVAKGSLQIEYILEGAAVGSNAPMALVGSNVNTDYIDVDEFTTGGTPALQRVGGAGILVANAAVASCAFVGTLTAAAGVIHRGASSWATGDVVRAAHDGLLNVSTTGTVTSTPTIVKLAIGGLMHAQSAISQWVRHVAYWPRQLSQAELQAVSSMPSLLNGVAIDNASIGETTPANGTFLRVKTGSITGPTWTTGSAAPLAVEPIGSLYSRAGGAVGATLYVSRGGGVWNAVAAV